MTSQSVEEFEQLIGTDMPDSITDAEVALEQLQVERERRAPCANNL
jgi:hypothetical protein